MEKQEMGFIEKFEAAGEEFVKEKGSKCHLLMYALDDESERICGVADVDARKLSELLAYAAIRMKNFKEILTNAVNAVEVIEQKNK